MTNNPFEYMQSFLNQDSFTKNFADNLQNTMQQVDHNAVNESFKKTMEAVSAAYKTASDNLQSVIKKNATTFQKNTTEMHNVMKDAISAGDLNQMNDCQQKYISTTIDNNFNNTKEIIDLSTKSTLQILDLMKNGLKEGVNKKNKKEKR